MEELFSCLVNIIVHVDTIWKVGVFRSRKAKHLVGFSCSMGDDSDDYVWDSVSRMRMFASAQALEE